MATAATAEMLPRFLLPRLSWQPATAPRRLATAAAVSPLAARQINHHNNSRRPQLLSARPGGSPILSRAFHATSLRARDHHFDTLKFVKRLHDEGFTEEQSVAMMKVLSDVIEERCVLIPAKMIKKKTRNSY